MGGNDHFNPSDGRLRMGFRIPPRQQRKACTKDPCGGALRDTTEG